MGFSFGSKKQSRTVALFDIGSGSIGAALVEIPADTNTTPTIIASVRTELAARTTLDLNVFFKDMTNALATTASKLYDLRAGAPEEIVCVLASPWYLSETRSIKMAKETPFVFNKQCADELLEKEILALSGEYQQKYAELGSESELIEHHVLSVSLNGYPVEEPLGKRSSSVQMDMVISLAPKLCLDAIRNTLLQTFHHTPVSFSSFMLLSFLAVREKYISPDSYLLLDIGGEVTDVALVSKGVLKASLSFPFGKRTFYTYMTSKLGIEMRDAKEVFTLFVTGTLSHTRREALLPLFTSIEKLWCEAFRGSIATLPHTLMIPDTVFLTADEDIREWFVDVLCNEGYFQSASTLQKCRVVTLKGPEFLNMCSIKNGACDPFLMIEAIGISRKNTKHHA